jgi:hypothetical protein
MNKELSRAYDGMRSQYESEIAETMMLLSGVKYLGTAP